MFHYQFSIKETKSVWLSKLYRQTAQIVEEYKDKKAHVYYSGCWSTNFLADLQLV
jgi:hypothetical protein